MNCDKLQKSGTLKYSEECSALGGVMSQHKMLTLLKKNAREATVKKDLKNYNLMRPLGLQTDKKG